MNFKYILSLILSTFAFISESQTLLNRNLSEIKRIITLQQGGLNSQSYGKAVFSYPIAREGNDCIFRTKCYFNSKQKCTKYINEYWGDSLAYQEIYRLIKSYPKLKKIQNNLVWTDDADKFKITLIHDKKSIGGYSLIIEVLP